MIQKNVDDDMHDFSSIQKGCKLEYIGKAVFFNSKKLTKFTFEHNFVENEAEDDF